MLFMTRCLYDILINVGPHHDLPGQVNDSKKGRENGLSDPPFRILQL